MGLAKYKRFLCPILAHMSLALQGLGAEYRDGLAITGNIHAILLWGEGQGLPPAVRTNTNTGWPSGSEAFRATLEAHLDRRLTRLPEGRRRRERGWEYIT
jgi:hypothetical protein